MPPPHSLTRRLAERFALVALSLYHLPLFLNNYPSLGGGSGGFSEGLAVSWGHIFTRPGIWLARILFGMTGPMTMASISYDVQVKLYATMIVISAGVLVLYDARRLLAVFVTNQSVPPASHPTVFEGRMPESLRWAIKLVLVGSVAASPG